MGGIVDDIDGATAVLLEVPSLGAGRDRCTAFLSEDVDPSGVLFVTYTRDAAACLAQLGDSVPGADRAVITVGTGSPTAVDGAEVRGLSSPSDLTGLGIEMSDVVADWDAPVALCFDSVTSMLQYVEFETAYEFLHTTIGRFWAAGARSHFHVDPAAHDAKTLARLTSLVDATVAVGDGEPAVRTRGVIGE